MTTIASDPYPWPYDGDLRPDNTALIIIDMQTDFCGVGGYVDKMGYDLSLTRAPIAPIRRLLDESRRVGMLVIHTREGHRPDLTDLQFGVLTWPVLELSAFERPFRASAGASPKARPRASGVSACRASTRSPYHAAG